MERILASIQTIRDIHPIEGADKIEIGKVLGWQAVIPKGKHRVGEKVVWFEIDSFLPCVPQFEFLRKGCFKSTKHLGDGFRIKTIKLRGQLSQGLILPIEDALGNSVDNPAEVAAGLAEAEDGHDLTELINVQKYEKPIPPQLAGRIRGNFPMFVRKTDQERVQNLLSDLLLWKQGDTPELAHHKYPRLFETTAKLDGSSMTVYFKDGVAGVCSRNLDLKTDDDDNTFVKIAKQEKLFDLLEAFFLTYGVELAIQGELIGPGIQDNYQGVDQHQFWLFDIFHIGDQTYLSPSERYETMTMFSQLGYPLRHVPIMTRLDLNALPSTTDELLQSFLTAADAARVEIAGARGPVNAEGLVFKALQRDRFGEIRSFKVISNNYLLGEKG